MVSGQNKEEYLKQAYNRSKELATKISQDINLLDYNYKTDEAVAELGVDDLLISQLVDDYVVQAIKSHKHFLDLLNTLKKAQEAQEALDFKPFRDLAHKNLGVARNLRIQDAQALLAQMMQSEDLEYLEDCIEALRVCSIKLRPEIALDAEKLLEVKSNF